MLSICHRIFIYSKTAVQKFKIWSLRYSTRVLDVDYGTCNRMTYDQESVMALLWFLQVSAAFRIRIRMDPLKSNFWILDPDPEPHESAFVGSLDPDPHWDFGLDLDPKKTVADTKHWFLCIHLYNTGTHVLHMTWNNFVPEPSFNARGALISFNSRCSSLLITAR